MAWEFTPVSYNDKFFVNLAMVQPNQTHNFYNDKYIVSSSDSKLTYRYDILLLLDGSIRLDIQTPPPVIINYADYVWSGDEDPTTPTHGIQLYNTNPFGYEEHSIYPLTAWASMTGMKDGAKWINIQCFEQEKRLEFACFKGPHVYMHYDSQQHYAVMLQGSTRVDESVLEQYQIREYDTQVCHFAMDATDDDIVIYVWEVEETN